MKVSFKVKRTGIPAPDRRIANLNWLRELMFSDSLSGKTVMVVLRCRKQVRNHEEKVIPMGARAKGKKCFPAAPSTASVGTALEIVMNPAPSLELTRDCEAVQIPHGSRVTLPQGTSVDITQTLGGTITIHANGGLYRIAGQDADALGMDPIHDAAPAPAGSGEVKEEDIWTALKTCYDPEIPVNIVDLGLVYDLVLEKLPGGQSRVDVKMTLTAPGCGMGATIAGDARQKLLALPGVEDANVEVVWDPQWHQSMITAEGRRILGLE